MADGNAQGAMTGIEGQQRAQLLLQRQAGMESERYNFETQWQRIAELIEPQSAQFQTRDEMQGQRRDFYQFDSTGALALERFAAAMESMVTPRTQKWCKLVAADKDLRNDILVQRYLDNVNDILFARRYAATAGFTTATNEYYTSLGAYGTSCMASEDDYRGRGIRYQTQYLGDVWLANNFQGVCDTVHRKFEWDARQALQKFGPGPDLIFEKEAGKPNPRKFHFLQCVSPTEDYSTQTQFRRMPIASHYVCIETQSVVQSGGYFTMPLIASRFSTAPRETYGRSPASRVLNVLNTVNEKQKTVLRAGQRSVEPPLLLPDDDVLRGFNMKSGALNYGGLDDQGNPRVVPLTTGANMPIGLEMIQDDQRIINESFYVTLFQILIENPRMTATEAMLRAQEKGALLAPPMGRQQTEFLGPLIQRDIDVAMRQGVLPEMPPQLAERNGMIEIEYDAPINKLAMADDAVAVQRTLEAVTPMAQIDPTVLDGFRLPIAAQIIARANGMPAEAMATEDEMAAKDAQRAAQAQAQALLTAAPVLSESAKNIAQAQQAGLSIGDPGALLGQ